MLGSLSAWRADIVSHEIRGSTMYRAIIAIAAMSSSVAGLAAGLPQGSLCEQVATQARLLPAAGWSGPGDSLRRLIERLEPASPRSLSPLEGELLQAPELRRALGAEPDQLLGLSRLPGSDLYRLDRVEGSAACQSFVFVEAVSGYARRTVATPIPGSPCWTQHGEFARVVGSPAFVVGGLDETGQFHRSYRIAPWREQGWAPVCSLRLKIAKGFRPAGRQCSADGPSCAAAEALSMPVVRAYEAERDGGPAMRLEQFLGSDPLPAELQAAAEAAKSRWHTPPALPADLSAGNSFLTGLANERVRTVALKLPGSWVLAFVGRAGVGWRESQTTLVGMYAVAEGRLTPLAAYRVDLVEGELLSAEVNEE